MSKKRGKGGVAASSDDGNYNFFSCTLEDQVVEKEGKGIPREKSYTKNRQVIKCLYTHLPLAGGNLYLYDLFWKTN